MAGHGAFASGWLVVTGSLATTLLAPAAIAQAAVEVRGKVVITDKGGKPARDVGDAVVWLDGGPPGRPGRAEIATERKTFLPRVVVVTAGSTVSFPNHDPFNHNVFSLADEAPFDLGLYGRHETRTATFPRAGVVRIYCNVHAQMSAFVVVRASPHFAQPGVDGTFVIRNVAPGRYQLRVWHERGGELEQPLVVGPGGAAELTLALDASGFRPSPHLNKFGKPYDREGRRY